MNKSEIARVPKCTFYYFHEHKNGKVVQDYAVEVTGVGKLVGKEAGVTPQFLVETRRLYNGAGGNVHETYTLEDFTGSIVKNDVAVPYFSEIQDPEIIKALTEISTRLYPTAVK